MKRFLFILTLTLLLGSVNCANAYTSYKADVKEIKSILKNQIQAANKYDYPDFIKYFDFGYINSDGFCLDIYSKLVEDTWTSYNNIQYAQKIKNITVNNKDAIVEVIETANAKIESEYNMSGHLKSIANNVYFLKKTTNGWRIVSDVIITEDTYLSFGELSNYTPSLNVPYQIGANNNYTATLEYVAPKNTIAIASINQEKVSYPQQASKENYRKLPDDGVLERFFTANGDGVNEYIVASLGLTRPEFEKNDLQINVTGIAYVIKRVNVIPENKFINKSDIIPVSRRLQQLKDEENRAEAAKTESKKQKKREIKQKDEYSAVKEINDNVVPSESTNQTKIDEAQDNKILPLEQDAFIINNVNNEEQSVSVDVEETTKSNVETGSEGVSDVNKEENNEIKETTELNKNYEKAGDSILEDDNDKKHVEPGDKAKTKNKKKNREKSLNGTYSPTVIGIPTTSTVCPIDESSGN